MKKRILFIIPGIITAVIFLLPTLIFGVFNTGNVMGLLISAIFLCYGFFFAEINYFVCNLHKKLSGKIILYFMCALTVCLVVFTSVTTKKMIDAAHNPPCEETTVIVLGCMVYPSGPSLSLIQRLDAAYAFLTKHPEAKCILSGGRGIDEPMSEAKAMQIYLTDRGIDPRRLYPEEKSTSTRENLRFSKEIIEREGLCPSVTIITNDFHQLRAQKIAENYFPKCYGVSGKSHPILLPCYYLRELGGILLEDLGVL